MRSLFSTLVLLSAASVLTSPPALAYIGPGGGLSAIGALLALLLGLAIAFFGFLWYPLRRMRRRRRERATGVTPPDDFPPDKA